MDFKDASPVLPDPSGEGTQLQVVELGNGVDAGTSILLSAQVPEDFPATTVLEAVICCFREHGCPPPMSFDHDPRWVGSSSDWDVPSALLRFLMAGGVDIRRCPPHQLQKNACVERDHRSGCTHGFV